MEVYTEMFCQPHNSKVRVHRSLSGQGPDLESTPDTARGQNGNRKSSGILSKCILFAPATAAYFVQHTSVRTPCQPVSNRYFKILEADLTTFLGWGRGAIKILDYRRDEAKPIAGTALQRFCSCRR